MCTLSPVSPVATSEITVVQEQKRESDVGVCVRAHVCARACACVSTKPIILTAAHKQSCAAACLLRWNTDLHDHSRQARPVRTANQLSDKRERGPEALANYRVLAPPKGTSRNNTLVA